MAAGTCTITASQAGNSTYAAGNFRLAELYSQGRSALKSQTITFGTIATQTVGTPLTSDRHRQFRLGRQLRLFHHQHLHGLRKHRNVRCGRHVYHHRFAGRQLDLCASDFCEPEFHR